MNLSQSYAAPRAIRDHTVLPAARHMWARPALTPNRQASSTLFTYPGGKKGWVDVQRVTKPFLQQDKMYVPVGTYVPHNSTLILVSLISFPFKTFSVLLSLCVRLNGQLACRLSSANHPSYHIIVYWIISCRIIRTVLICVHEPPNERWLLDVTPVISLSYHCVNVEAPFWPVNIRGSVFILFLHVKQRQ